MPSVLKAERTDDAAVVKAPIFNVTYGGTIGAAVAAIIAAWSESFEVVFGFEPKEHPGVSAAVVIAIIAGVVLLWIGDMIARAVASRSGDTTVGVVPKGWTASISKPGPDPTGYAVAAVRLTVNGPEYLLVKDGEAPAWHALAGIGLDIPPPPK